MTGVNLSTVSLSGVDLGQVNLTNANLSGQSLAGINFTGATIAGANFTGATGLSINRSIPLLTIRQGNFLALNFSGQDFTGGVYGGKNLDWDKFRGCEAYRGQPGIC